MNKEVVKQDNSDKTPENKQLKKDIEDLYRSIGLSPNHQPSRPPTHESSFHNSYHWYK
jgi:hypothetical protein